MNKLNIMWFRDDLRVQDNTALYQASQSQHPVVALYIVTPAQWQEHNLAPIQADFIARRLACLQQQLQDLAVPLVILQGNTFSDIPDLFQHLLQQLPIAQVYANNQYIYNENLRDNAVQQLLNTHDVSLTCYDDKCILPPGSVTTKTQQMYKVYTPFRNAWLQIYLQHQSSSCNVAPLPVPTFERQHQLALIAASYDGFASLVTSEVAFNYPRISSSDWPVTDADIAQQLSQFCEERVFDYARQRDYPALPATSRLSPYLAIGALSARQCLAALGLSLNFKQGAFWENKESGAFTWWNELVWREFYQHLSAAYPRLSKNKPFHQWAENLRWLHNASHLTAWQQGRTGFPIVDAAMRQLLHTGWMHNRLRMVVASFLTKELQQDWRLGECWFMQHLIDGEFAANNGGWQWSASTGVDAQPYFRIFNPTAQGKRFDADGEFIRQWVPELATVPNKYIHQPELWSGSISLDYPAPIIERKITRQQTLTRFKQAKLQAEALR
ncbi:MAG: deoxyribodipyrimidine photo-lyase [Moritella sp.]|jgi:deoxyribodipyrimidine photo-lyase